MLFDIIKRMTKHIAIITVVYNNYTILDEFCDSLRSQSIKNFHLYIADASSNKQPIDISDFPHTILPIENKGYAHGVNEGLKQAKSDGIEHFCVINDDVYFEKTFVADLEKSFQSHPKTVFGGKIYYASGYEFHKDRYESKDLGNVLWYAGGAVDWNHATTSHRGVDDVDQGQYNTEEKTDFITGCLTCFDKATLDAIGFWDEKYFLYYEDADFCERAKRENIDLWYTPEIRIWHKNAQSTEGSGSALHQSFQKKSHLKYALKYAPFRTKVHVLKNYFLSLRDSNFSDTTK